MEKSDLDIWEVFRVSSGLGLLIALPISGGTILGFLLDKSLKTGPLFTLVFLAGGICLAFFAVFKKVKEIQ